MASRRASGGDDRAAARCVSQSGMAGAIGPLAPDDAEPEVVVRGIVRERDGHCSSRCFSSTRRCPTADGRFTRWLCQAHLEVAATDGSPVFVRRQIDAISLAPAVDRVELAGLEMQYRANVELAVGHGVGVQATEATEAPGRGTRLQTTVMPAEEVPLTEAPGPDDFEDASIREPFTDALTALDMQTLSEHDRR